MNIFNTDEMIDVRIIRALKSLPKSDQTDIELLYTKLREQRQNYYVNWEIKRIKQRYNTTETKAYLCLNRKGVLKPFGKILLNGNYIHYETVDRHLSELNISKERALYLIISTLFRPVFMNGIALSIITDRDIFLNVLAESDDENEVVCVLHQNDTSNITINKTDSNTPSEQVFVVDGVVVIG